MSVPRRRAVLTIPCSDLSIRENAWGLARYASVCQVSSFALPTA